MNFLFGTQFVTAAGRCTKGIYCSLMKYECPYTHKVKNILILDTEGIQSAEARDTNFDKRIVFFIVCVSHVVLMCNKGEMNSTMSEVVKLVADAVINTKAEIIRNPSIYIVLNMLSEVNTQIRQQSINDLRTNLLD